MKRQGRGGVSSCGFTLIEILIVVAIIGVLLAIAVPSFVRTRERSWQRACIKNLHGISNAKEQSMMDRKLPRDAPASEFSDSVLYGPGAYILHKPACPGGGNYDVGDGLTYPTCDYAGAIPHEYDGG